jgi:hypothetical protein
MNPRIQLRCCICGHVVEQEDSDGYSLQVRKLGGQSPEMVWAHGSCLRKVIPVIGVENTDLTKWSDVNRIGKV